MTILPVIEHEVRADQIEPGDYITGLGRVLDREVKARNVTIQGERPWRLAIARAERLVVIRA